MNKDIDIEAQKKEIKKLFLAAYSNLRQIEKILPNVVVAIEKNRRDRIFPDLPYCEKQYEWRKNESERIITNVLHDINFAIEHLEEIK